MRIRFIILSHIFLPLMFSCTEHEELTNSPRQPEENIPAGISRVAFTGGPQSQCVYIFRKEGNDFRYHSMINSGWSADGKVTARLLTGDYKFLFTGPLDGQTDVLPSALTSSVTPDQLHFAAKTDDVHTNYILPAGELFLPEPDVADLVYTIRGNDEIKCTLKRRVSQLEFVLRRGYKEEGKYVARPYSDGHNVLENISELQIEITGVARYCNFQGTFGKGDILCTYLASECENIDAQGFATFTGPFVFPPAGDAEVMLHITPISSSGVPYQMLTLPGKLEANRKLEVNLWFNPSYYDIGVTIRNRPITQQTDGDTGIWE